MLQVKKKKFEVLDYGTVFKGLFTLVSSVTSNRVTSWDAQNEEMHCTEQKRDSL